MLPKTFPKERESFVEGYLKELKKSKRETKTVEISLSYMTYLQEQCFTK